MIPGLIGVVINSPDRIDLLAGFVGRWWRAGLPAHTEIFPALNGSAGCLASHLAVLESHPGPLLVLEDDAVRTAAFTWDVHPLPGWDVCWLGFHAYIARDPHALAASMRGLPTPRPN